MVYTDFEEFKMKYPVSHMTYTFTFVTVNFHPNGHLAKASPLRKKTSQLNEWVNTRMVCASLEEILANVEQDLDLAARAHLLGWIRTARPPGSHRVQNNYEYQIRYEAGAATASPDSSSSENRWTV